MTAPTTTVQQRKRSKGWRMPEGSVCVDRTSWWGNPWVIQRILGHWRVILPGHAETEHFDNCDEAASYAASRYCCWLVGVGDPLPALEERRRWILDHVHELAGKTLLCWCPQPGPCHAHVLATLADSGELGLDTHRQEYTP